MREKTIILFELCTIKVSAAHEQIYTLKLPVLQRKTTDIVYYFLGAQIQTDCIIDATDQ